MFGHSHAIMVFCREWMDLLLGPLRRYPMRLGMLDLTPLIFIILLRLVHSLLMALLWTSYQSVQ